MYAYPASDLDRGNALLALLGSFWARSYAAAGQVKSYAAAVGRAAAQPHLDLLEALDCLARDTVPVFHVDQWRVAYLRASDRHAVGPPARFGAGRLLGDGLAFGYRLDAPPAVDRGPVVDVSWIFNRVVGPTRSLAAGLDFRLDADRIVFRHDPFLDPRFATRPLFDATGAEVDRELALWLYRPRSDRGYIRDHFGFVIGLRLASSAGYRELVDAVLDALVSGPAATRIAAALAAMTGAPLAREPAETVEVVAEDDRGPLVITDLSAYRLPPGSRPLVTVGQRLEAADPLCDAAAVYELNRGLDASGLRGAVPSLPVGPGLLKGLRTLADLTFADGDVPVEVGRDPEGRTTVRFPLVGHPADQDAFWAEVHRRGVASGRTLAHLLDRRDQPVGEPAADALPKTINPLRFLVDTCLRGNAAVARLRGGATPMAVGVEPLRLLRRAISPHAALIVLVDLPPAADPVVDDDPAETLASYAALVSFVEDEEPDPTADGPHRARTVSRTCR